MTVAGIMFDMDNTLLRSRIDFASMKQEVYEFLRGNGCLSELRLDRYTTSMLIDQALAGKGLDAELTAKLWDIPKRHELAGMQGAGLEPGAVSVLNRLHRRYRLAIVTNNSLEAAGVALRDNGILPLFDVVAGREQMGTMKPAPDGFLHVLRNSDIPADQWVSVGDSWIDGAGSEAAGIRFIAYQANREQMTERGVKPVAWIEKLEDLNHWLDQGETSQ